MHYLKKYLFLSFIIFSLSFNFALAEETNPPTDDSGDIKIVSPNKTDIIDKLKAKMDKGDAEAMLKLANIYMDGKIAEKDPEKAFELYNLSASKGNNNAMLALAAIYSDGVGIVEKNLKEAFFWFQKSAEWGNSFSQFLVGTMFVQGVEEAEVPLDIEIAYKWLRIAEKTAQLPRLKKAAGGLADILVEKLSAEQLQRLEKEVKEWQPKTGNL